MLAVAAHLTRARRHPTCSAPGSNCPSRCGMTLVAAHLALPACSGQTASHSSDSSRGNNRVVVELLQGTLCVQERALRCCCRSLHACTEHSISDLHVDFRLHPDLPRPVAAWPGRDACCHSCRCTRRCCWLHQHRRGRPTSNQARGGSASRLRCSRGWAEHTCAGGVCRAYDTGMRSWSWPGRGPMLCGVSAEQLIVS